LITGGCGLQLVGAGVRTVQALAWALSEVMRLRGSEGMKELVKELHAGGYDDITLEDLMGEVYEQRSSAGGIVGGAECRERAVRTFDAG
jgi:hypothetical protein